MVSLIRWIRESLLVWVSYCHDKVNITQFSTLHNLYCGDYIIAHGICPWKGRNERLAGSLHPRRRKDLQATEPVGSPSGCAFGQPSRMHPRAVTSRLWDEATVFFRAFQTRKQKPGETA